MVLSFKAASHPIEKWVDLSTENVSWRLGRIWTIVIVESLVPQKSNGTWNKQLWSCGWIKRGTWKQDFFSPFNYFFIRFLYLLPFSVPLKHLVPIDPVFFPFTPYFRFPFAHFPIPNSRPVMLAWSAKPPSVQSSFVARGWRQDESWIYYKYSKEDNLSTSRVYVLDFFLVGNLPRVCVCSLVLFTCLYV